MLNVIVYQDSGKRSRYIGEAMFAGIKSCGDKVRVCNADSYDAPEDSADIAVFYGLKRNLKKIFYDYIDAGKKSMLIDLGYWNRVEGGKLQGYHKTVVNSYHPTDYMQGFMHDDSRVKKLGINPKPFNKGGSHILLAGMSGKSAWANDLLPLEYETTMVRRLKAMTKRKIIYRPKPTWKDAKPIPGTEYSPPSQDLNEVLQDCWAVVSHHSNVSIDAILAGVPVFVEDNAPARLVGETDIRRIEKPNYPGKSQVSQWLNDLSYQQWTPAEMSKGVCWQWYKERGIV